MIPYTPTHAHRTHREISNRTAWIKYHRTRHLACLLPFFGSSFFGLFYFFMVFGFYLKSSLSSLFHVLNHCLIIFSKMQTTWRKNKHPRGRRSALSPSTYFVLPSANQRPPRLLDRLEWKLPEGLALHLFLSMFAMTATCRRKTALLKTPPIFKYTT